MRLDPRCAGAMEDIMSVLYVVTPGASVRRRGNRLCVVGPDGELLEELEAKRLHSVLVLGSVQLTTQAMTLMLKHGIELAILSRNGKLLGQLTPPLAHNIELRKAQFRLRARVGAATPGPAQGKDSAGG